MRLAQRLEATTSPEREPCIEVVNETTLQGIAALHEEGAERIGALNFASAKNPGGGFLNGSEAREESLARSSALYASLQQVPMKPPSTSKMAIPFTLPRSSPSRLRAMP
jgi:uncharacterized protein (TIGR02452 family)